MNIITVSRDTVVTLDELSDWIITFKTAMLPRLKQAKSFYLNEQKMSLPYAAKLTTIATAATVGDGIEVKPHSDINDAADPDQLSDAERSSLDTVLRLFRRQCMSAQDLAVITDGSVYGVGYELCFMSSDDVPKPKCKDRSPLNTFVVFDDTAEQNSLYGVYFIERTDKSGKKSTEINLYDEAFVTTIVLPYFIESTTESNACANTVLIGDSAFETFGAKLLAYTKEPHHMGRMPLTVYFNNRDVIGDFERVMRTIEDRNMLNAFALDDAETIANNYMVLKGAELAGTTAEEKKTTILKMGKTKVLELEAGQDVSILTKQETFNMISVFGNDLDDKIYDLSMICNFTSEEFAGNASGIALRLKLFAFKKLISNKDVYIEKLYRRRLKMYLHTLSALDASVNYFDVGKLDVVIHRTWEENITELAQVIAQLAPLGLFSDKYLVERMPDGDYETESAQIQAEREEKKVQELDESSALNSGLGDFNALMRGLAADPQSN